jgi:hypothetical protein
VAMSEKMSINEKIDPIKLNLEVIKSKSEKSLEDELEEEEDDELPVKKISIE